MTYTYKCSMYAPFVTRDSPIPAILCSASQVWWSPQPRWFYSSNQVCSRVVVAQTLCPSHNLKGSNHKGLNRGTVQATSVTTSFGVMWRSKCLCHHNSWKYLIWRTESPRLWRPSHLTCWAEYGRNWTIVCDEGCIHRTFVGICHKLVELLFHFY